jgi:hypothetical protein
MVYSQNNQVKVNNDNEDTELGISNSKLEKPVQETAKDSQLVKTEEAPKSIPWAEKLNQCLGSDSIFQNSSNSLHHMADVFEKIRGSYGEPQEDTLVLEETVIKWRDGENRTLRWEPSKEFQGMGDLFWYGKDVEKEGAAAEPLDLPDDIETPVSVEDYDRLVREGQMLNQTQSRFLKYDGGLDVGLMIRNNEVSGISLEFNQKEVHCQEKADKSVDCECLSKTDSIKE